MISRAGYVELEIDGAHVMLPWESCSPGMGCAALGDPEGAG